MLLHISHFCNLQELLLLPIRSQRAVIDFLASVLYLREKVGVHIREVTMFLDVSPEFINEGVPALFVSHTFNISSFESSSLLFVCRSSFMPNCILMRYHKIHKSYNCLNWCHINFIVAITYFINHAHKTTILIKDRRTT